MEKRHHEHRFISETARAIAAAPLLMPRTCEHHEHSVFQSHSKMINGDISWECLVDL